MYPYMKIKGIQMDIKYPMSVGRYPDVSAIIALSHLSINMA
jgi:hypothetical protein